MKQVDKFVLLDDVQFAKRSWQQRNRVKSSSGPVWLSVPALTKGKRDQLVREVRISPDSNWSEKHFATIRSCYRRAAHWAEIEHVLSQFFASQTDRLLETNTASILLIRQQLGIETPIVSSSSLDAADGRVDRLVDICQRLDADEYLSPIGSHEYLRDSKAFDEAGIDLQFQNFEHPNYEQLHGDFVPFMSAVDLLCNALPDAADIIAAGIRSPFSVQEVPSHDA